VIEEKLDGTNLGISTDDVGALRFQTRGNFVAPPFRGQFEVLRLWMSRHELALHALIHPGLVLFGEWCYARHSVMYDRLRDWFYLFDIYSIVGDTFWSTPRRNTFAQEAGLEVVPEIAQGRFSLSKLAKFATEQSLLGPELREGIYVRVENDQSLTARAKLINPTFTGAIQTHWSKQKLRKNRLAIKIS
jgi:ATP-dependent RNA circularization protein (DNA/RNA ligase family)